MKDHKISIDPKDWEDYSLIDAGNRQKLERWGDVITIRPEINANFSPKLDFNTWKNQADYIFFQDENRKKGSWKKLNAHSPEVWSIDVEGVKAELKLTQFKHLGIFPEQIDNWRFIKQHVNAGDKVLNLFAYTGLASVIAKSQKGDVYHVDSVKQLISWARQNMELSKLSDIRWVHEDAFKFAKRCQKRGQKFDLIIMDPPAYGIGANKERWKIEDKMEELIQTASKILAPNGKLVINTYTPKINLAELTFLANKYFANKNITPNNLWMKSEAGDEVFYGNIIRIV